MKCLACGSPGAKQRSCCADLPKFCDGCNEKHCKIAHKDQSPKEGEG